MADTRTIDEQGDDAGATRVGQRIHARRVTLDLSREELAERAASDPLLILAYELGQGLPAPMDMVRIARALDASVGFFFAGDARANRPRRHGISEHHAT